MLTDMDEKIQPEQEQEGHVPKWVWARNVLFLVLGILTLFLGSFLLTDKVGPESLFVLLLWCLPLFVH
jgi:hypothetical protein